MIEGEEKRDVKEYVTVKIAAEFLGISKGTLRKWSDENKVKFIRHPFNKYRIYKRSDLETLIWKLYQKLK